MKKINLRIKGGGTKTAVLKSGRWGSFQREGVVTFSKVFLFLFSGVVACFKKFTYRTTHYVLIRFFPLKMVDVGYCRFKSFYVSNL